MSDSAEATATAPQNPISADSDASTVEADAEQQATPKPTETVEFWRAKAREQEKRAKANADAAAKLAEIEQANKTDAEKAAERIAELQKAANDAKAETIRFKVAAKHGISDEDADLFLTGADEATLTRQAERFAELNADTPKQGNFAPLAGKQSRPPKDDRQALADFMTGRTR